MTATIVAVAVVVLAGREAVVAGSQDGRVRIWDLSTGAPAGSPFTAHEAGLNTLAVAELHGRAIAVTAGRDRTLAIWDLADGRRLGVSLPAPGMEATALACVELSGRPVACAGGDDGTLQLWDLDVGSPFGQPWSAHSGPITAVATAHVAGSTIVITAGADGRLRAWDPYSGASRVELREGGQVPIVAVTVVKVGQTAVAGDALGNLHVWDTETGAPLGGPFQVHEHSVTALACADVAGRSSVVSCSSDGHVRVWDLFGSSLVPGNATISGPPASSLALAVSAGTPVIVAGSDDGAVRIWDLSTGAALGELLLDQVESTSNRLADEDHAIVIGVNVYRDLPPLATAVLAARAMWEWLVDPTGGGVPPGNVSAAYDSDSESIAEVFRRLLDRRTAQGAEVPRRLYVYMAGYGGIDQHGQAVFVTDTGPDRQTIVPVEQIAGVIADARLFAEVVLILDLGATLISKAPATFVEPAPIPPAPEAASTLFVTWRAEARPADEPTDFTNALLGSLRPGGKSGGAVAADLTSWARASGLPVPSFKLRGRPITLGVAAEPGPPATIAAPRPSADPSTTPTFPAFAVVAVGEPAATAGFFVEPDLIATIGQHRADTTVRLGERVHRATVERRMGDITFLRTERPVDGAVVLRVDSPIVQIGSSWSGRGFAGAKAIVIEGTVYDVPTAFGGRTPDDVLILQIAPVQAPSTMILAGSPVVADGRVIGIVRNLLVGGFGTPGRDLVEALTAGALTAAMTTSSPAARSLADILQAIGLCLHTGFGDLFEEDPWRLLGAPVNGLGSEINLVRQAAEWMIKEAVGARLSPRWHDIRAAVASLTDILPNAPFSSVALECLALARRRRRAPSGPIGLHESGRFTEVISPWLSASGVAIGGPDVLTIIASDSQLDALHDALDRHLRTVLPRFDSWNPANAAPREPAAARAAEAALLLANDVWDGGLTYPLTRFSSELVTHIRPRWWQERDKLADGGVPRMSATADLPRFLDALLSRMLDLMRQLQERAGGRLFRSRYPIEEPSARLVGSRRISLEAHPSSYGWELEGPFGEFVELFAWCTDELVHSDEIRADPDVG